MSKLKKRKRYSENNVEFYAAENCITNRALEPSYHSNSTDNDLMKQQYQKAAAGGAAPINPSKPNNSGTNKKSSFLSEFIRAFIEGN